jgi:acyl dehydratase
VTSLSLALALGFVLAFLAHRGRTKLERERVEASKPVPPHEEVKAEVVELRKRLEIVEAWAKVTNG